MQILGHLVLVFRAEVMLSAMIENGPLTTMTERESIEVFFQSDGRTDKWFIMTYDTRAGQEEYSTLNF